MDETRRGRPKWVWNTLLGSWIVVADRWHVGFVDLAGGQGLLGQVEGRTKASVVDWLEARGTEWKNAVKVIAIDMCSVFKSAGVAETNACAPAAQPEKPADTSTPLNFEEPG
ncbi:transposase [Actinomadura alba]|uniref:Transposase n=1 Tax=Actinomadura alba TaxID=406431 RepID=A0ABR7M099_9ACTN|nr:transposase [Actinomadura alba]MBC6470155.1 transposase [Actinomadura alba]